MRKNIFFSIFAFLIIIMLVSYVFTLSSAGEPIHLTFSYFLDLIENYEPLFQYSSAFETFYVSESWGVFDFFRVFVNNFFGVLSILVYLGRCLIIAIEFLIHFIVSIFFV